MHIERKTCYGVFGFWWEENLSEKDLKVWRFTKAEILLIALCRFLSFGDENLSARIVDAMRPTTELRTASKRAEADINR